MGKVPRNFFKNGPSNGPFCVIEKPNSNDVSFVMVGRVTDDRIELTTFLKIFFIDGK